MAHPCPKCGASVEDAKRFCGECGALQESDDAGDRTPATNPLPPGTPGEVQPPAYPVFPAPHMGVKPPASDRRLFLGSSLIAAGLGILGIFLAALLATATGSAAAQPFIFLLMIATGGIAVTLFTRRGHTGLTAGRGFKLGLLAGFFAGMVLLVISLPSLVSANGRTEIRTKMTEMINNASAANPDPSAKDQAKQVNDMISTSGGLALLLILLIGIMAFMYMILAGIGGAVGAALFGRTSPPQAAIPS